MLYVRIQYSDNCEFLINLNIDIMEVLRGSIPCEFTPVQALGKIVERFLKNIGSWACTTKIFILFHRCL
jgi:hypothetical protein